MRKTQRKERTKANDAKRRAAYARQQAKMIKSLPNPDATRLIRRALDATEDRAPGFPGGLGTAVAMALAGLLGKSSITVDVEGGDPIIIRSIDMQAVAMQKFASWAAAVAVPPDMPSDIRITQPVGHCDGSKKYKYDPSKNNGRGEKLAIRCLGCRACS